MRPAHLAADGSPGPGHAQAFPETAITPFPRASVGRSAEGNWSPAMVEDPVQEHLLKLIASKKRRKGTRVSAGRDEGGRPTNVVNLFDALKKNLQADKSLRS